MLDRVKKGLGKTHCRICHSKTNHPIRIFVAERNWYADRRAKALDPASAVVLRAVARQNQPS